MKLKALLKDIPDLVVKGSKESDITGITAHSKACAPGNLFIAKKGSSGEGHKYIQEACLAGAACIVTDLYNPFFSVAQVMHPNPASLEGILASQYYKEPSKELYMVGVTGTSGKTTTSFLVKHLLDAYEMACGLIGTIEYVVGGQRYRASLTTPDNISNHRLLKEMVVAGQRACVMEVSSHALEQGRVNAISFDAAIFTNLSHDHLDYHGTMEAYAEAKKKLFAMLTADQVAIVNSDSPYAKEMLEGCKAKSISYGFQKGAMVQAEKIDLRLDGTRFEVNGVSFSLKLVGMFNVHNALAAIALAMHLGMSLEKIASVLAHIEPVPGRLERVVNNLGLNIYVDYSHKPDALQKVLETLIELKKGKLITLFGCGGNRDKQKRPKMAQIAEKFSDVTIVTSDNPREEDPYAIIKEIETGFSCKNYLVEVDRKCAIEKAIQMAKPSDIILIAGKGHEPYQIFAHRTIEFDDRLVAASICNGGQA